MSWEYTVEKLYSEIYDNGKYIPSELVIYKTLKDDSGIELVKVLVTNEELSAGIPDGLKDIYVSYIRTTFQEQLLEILNDNIQSSHPTLGTILGKNIAKALVTLNILQGFLEQPNGSLGLK